MKSVTVVDFSEIFGFAETRLGWNWNKCNDQFFNTVIRYKEATTIYLADTQSELEWQDDEPNESPSRYDRKAVYQCLIDFMLEHKLTEMLVK